MTTVKNQKINTDYFQTLAKEYSASIRSDEVVDAVTFAEANWGLGISLFPMQRFILKCFYGLELSTYNMVEIRDLFNTKTIAEFSEADLIEYLIEEKRTNLKKYTVGKRFRELILCCGRRASKCSDANALIYTTKGSMTYGELLKRFKIKERIGLFTFKEGKVVETYDIKVEDNGRKDCLRVETRRGYNEVSTLNHPYLVWRNGMTKPEFINAEELKIGDFVACPRKVGGFGTGGIGVVCAKLIGCLYGAYNAVIDDCCFEYEDIEKDIPNSIYEGTKEEVVSFLAALFNAGGFVSDGENSSLNITLDSKKVICGVQRLLLQFGISCTIEYSDSERYTLSIQDDESKKIFCEEFPCFCNEKINTAIEDSPDGLLMARINDDTLNEYCNGSIIWDEVASIEQVGVCDTIAIEVEDTHIIVNEIVTHNSVLTSIIANYELYKLIKMGDPQKYYGFPSGQDIAISAVATSDEQASVLFNMIKARGFNCNFLKDRIGNNTQTYFNISTDEDLKKDNRPTLNVLCGSVNSSFLRGPNNILVVMDEVAHMNKTTKNAASRAYTEISPSVLTFVPADGVNAGDGKIVLLSSPFSKNDFFYEKYRDSFNDESSLMFQMYTSMINIRVDSDFLRNEYRKDRDSFMCEYGGEFSDTISSWIDEDRLYPVLMKDKTVNEYEGRRGVNYYMGIDFGAKNDGSSISIVHKEGNEIIHDYSEVYYAGTSDVWNEKNSIYANSSNEFTSMDTIQIKDLAEIIKNICLRFNVVDGWFDQFNGYGLLERLRDLGLKQFRMVAVSAALNTKIFQLTKSMIEGRLIQIINHDILIPEMLLLEENRSSSNIVVKAPNRDGAHDDITDSFVRAVYACYEENKSAPNSTFIVSGGYSGSLIESTGRVFSDGSSKRTPFGSKAGMNNAYKRRR